MMADEADLVHYTVLAWIEAQLQPGPVCAAAAAAAAAAAWPAAIHAQLALQPREHGPCPSPGAAFAITLR